ncbi:MAG: hypothetical protein ACOYJG_05045 [Prevotella sp.]|jgi:hypothetical protein
MKFHIDWIKLLVFFLAAGGLILITGSFFMALGIMLLLLLADSLIAQWQHRKQFEKDLKDILDKKDKEQHE